MSEHGLSWREVSSSSSKTTSAENSSDSKSSKTKSSLEKSQSLDSFTLSETSQDKVLQLKLQEERVKLEKEAFILNLNDERAKLEKKNQQLSKQLKESDLQVARLKKLAEKSSDKESNSGVLESTVKALRAENELLRHSQREWKQRLEKLLAESERNNIESIEKKHAAQAASLKAQIAKLEKDISLSESKTSLLEADKEFLEKLVRSRDDRIGQLTRQVNELHEENARQVTKAEQVSPLNQKNELLVLYETLKLSTKESLTVITRDLERLHFQSEQQRLDTTSRLEQNIDELKERNKRLELSYESALADMHLQQLQAEKQYMSLSHKLRAKSDEHQRLLKEWEEAQRRCYDFEFQGNSFREKFELVKSEFNNLHADLTSRLKSLLSIDTSKLENPSEDWKPLLLDLLRFLRSWEATERADTLPAVSTPGSNVPVVLSTKSTSVLVSADAKTIQGLQERLEKALKDKSRLLHVARAILDSRSDYKKLIKVLRLLILSASNPRQTAKATLQGGQTLSKAQGSSNSRAAKKTYPRTYLL